MMSHTYSLIIFYPIVLSFVAMVASLGFYLFWILLFSFLLILRWFRLPRVPKYAVKAFFGDKTNKPLLIAHRGAALDAPENTLEAFMLAYENGADGIEFDLEFTSDSHPVIIHDDTVDRTTDGEGEVSSFTLEAIQKLNAGAKHETNRLGKLKIPTLEEAIVLCLKLKMKMFIDCKRNAKLTAKCLSELFKRYPDLYKEAIVCSFFPHIIYKVRKVDPKIVTALTFKHQFIATNLNQKTIEWWHQILACIGDILLEAAHHVFLWYLCGNSACLMSRRCYSSNAHTFWRNRGLRVVLWTVNDPKEKDYLLHSEKVCVITDTVIKQED